jgi:hypothetical protein
MQLNGQIVMDGGPFIRRCCGTSDSRRAGRIDDQPICASLLNYYIPDIILLERLFNK